MERDQQYRKDQIKTQQFSERTNVKSVGSTFTQLQTTSSERSDSEIQIEQKSDRNPKKLPQKIVNVKSWSRGDCFQKDSNFT